MGMVMLNNELVESGAYPYGFATEVEAWREVLEDRDSEASALISIEALELSGDLDPSVNLASEPVIKDLVSSLLGLSLGSGPKPPGAIPALKSLLGGGEEYVSNNVLDVASTLAAQKQFRSEGLYQYNWYRESASDSIKYL
ncbi:hypothetical protein AYI68_g780 [Smittium mucronatum]|uniref:Uncharacterized protein n=1 Tax=Smittium mucronatum TaxID=133383 RepID=A0A1R0H7J6_9FUNG|nr:hypothetical protein AYI68_g780 [Smittium mucronatum]